MPQLPKMVGVKSNELLKLDIFDTKIVDQVSEDTLRMISETTGVPEECPRPWLTASDSMVFHPADIAGKL